MLIKAMYSLDPSAFHNYKYENLFIECFTTVLLMDKEKFIKRYGEAAYQGRLETNKRWNKRNPERNKGHSRKGGKYYDGFQKYLTMGIQGGRHRIRNKHASRWRKYKGNWLTETEIHHCWISGTAKYNGIAIVDKFEHKQGIINPIRILEGKVELIGIGEEM